MTKEEKPYWMSKPTKTVLNRVKRIQNVASEIKRTVRKITYILYPGLKGEELDRAYNTVIKDTVRGRLWGMIPWENIKESRTKFVDIEGYEDIDDFMERLPQEDLTTDYWLSKRPAHKRSFLIWFEKATVEDEFEEICLKYDVPFLCGRGQATWTTKHNMAIEYLDEDWTVLYFGDGGDKGYEIYEVIKRDLSYQGCHAEVIWCMMTEDIERKYGLPPDSNLDGLELDDLMTEIENVVLQYIDIKIYRRILRQEERDKKELRKYRTVLQRID